MANGGWTTRRDFFFVIKQKKKQTGKCKTLAKFTDNPFGCEYFMATSGKNK
jgi:hypothetical protein